jgi:HPt (histidine-containing phosphotransfer) domain-containing protein
MKSVAGTLGAKELSTAAILLEEAIAGNIEDQIAERLNNFEDSLNIIISSLDTGFSRPMQRQTT